MTLQTLHHQALGRHKQGELAVAENLYRQLLAPAPQSLAARHRLGVLKTQQGAAAQALALLAEALKQRPDAADAPFNDADVLKAAGWLEEARNAYDKALARAEVLNAHSSALRETGRHVEALACHARALAIVSSEDRG